MTTFARGTAATWDWKAPTLQLEAPALLVVDAAGVEHAPPFAPLVAAELDGYAAALVDRVEGDRRTLQLHAELDLAYGGAGNEGDAWLVESGGHLHQVRVGTGVASQTLRLTDPLQALPAISAERPGRLQWATYRAVLGADVLGVEGLYQWRVDWTGRDATGPSSGVWRVVRRFETGLTLHEFYEAYPRYNRDATRHGEARAAIENVRAKIETRLRRALQPHDETAVVDGRQLCRCHILWTAADLEVGPENLDMRRQLLLEGQQEFDDVVHALLVDLNGDGVVDPQPFRPPRWDFRGAMPRRIWTTRRPR